MEYIDPLKRRMREQVLLAMVQPYQRVTVAFLAKELNQTPTEVVSALIHSAHYTTAATTAFDAVTGGIATG
jgi:PCI domain